jgi:hypothetical protein
MSLNSVRYGCTSLLGVNKAGELKQDDNGYYEMIVGGLDVYNSAGQLYVFEEAKKLFEESGSLLRRVKRGVLRGEYGHLKLQPGMRMEDFMARALVIDEQLCCCHHREIWLDFDRVKDENGKPVIAIMSKVAPSGPFGGALEESLKNPNENVCFSIRGFTDDFREQGVTKRVLKQIITWDYVNEPGISHAEKYKSPSLESMDEQIVFKNQLEGAATRLNSVSCAVASESILLTADELMTSMGWKFEGNKPNYFKW